MINVLERKGILTGKEVLGELEVIAATTGRKILKISNHPQRSSLLWGCSSIKNTNGGFIMTMIGPFMSSPVFTTTPNTLAHEAMVIMLENKVGALLVKENEEFVGIFSKADWIRKVVKGEGSVSFEKVRSVMTKNIIMVERSEALAKASLLMENHRIRHIAVTDNGKIVGIISVKDLENYYHQLHDQD